MFKVTNKNGFDFDAKFNGVSYYFPKGKAVYVEDIPAAHIFAIGNQDKISVLARHGWSTVGNTVEQGMKILNNFAFVHSEHKLDAPLASAAGEDDGSEGYGPAPVVQDTPDDNSAADDASESSGVVEEKPRRGRPPGFGKAFSIPQMPSV